MSKSESVSSVSLSDHPRSVLLVAFTGSEQRLSEVMEVLRVMKSGGQEVHIIGDRPAPDNSVMLNLLSRLSVALLRNPRPGVQSKFSF
nr:MAG: hypothetical protein [Microvirus sp.]